MKTKVTKDLENKTLIIERSFEAPKEKVWRAYSEKAWFEKWWGPEGWETTTKQFEFTPGGRIHYCMKCLDKNQTEWYGKETWGRMDIEAINEPNSFSAKDFFSDAEGVVNSELPSTRFTVELIEEGNQTRLVSKTYGESAEKIEELIKMGMVEGYDSQLNRLETMLKE